jgi:hypothetical protein
MKKVKSSRILEHQKREENRMTKEKKATTEDAHPHMHTHSPLLSELPFVEDYSMRINPLDEDRLIPISQATLKLLDSFCGSKTYDEVITSLIQKERGD